MKAGTPFSPLQTKEMSTVKSGKFTPEIHHGYPKLFPVSKSQFTEGVTTTNTDGP